MIFTYVYLLLNEKNTWVFFFFFLETETERKIFEKEEINETYFAFYIDSATMPVDVGIHIHCVICAYLPAESS